jgi:hypothetical protein
MMGTTHSGRIVSPVTYTERDGNRAVIPVGPCLLEQVDLRMIDIIWGELGQRSAEIPIDDMALAAGRGLLVLID